MASNSNLIGYFGVNAIGFQANRVQASENRTLSKCLESGLQLQHLDCMISARFVPFSNKPPARLSLLLFQALPPKPKTPSTVHHPIFPTHHSLENR